MDKETGTGIRLVGLSGAVKDKTYALDKEEFLVGRARDCDLRLEENTISGRHAKILNVEDHYEVEDLQSTNGTFLNGMRVTRKRLRSGDRVKFDQVEFQFIDPADVSRTIVATPAALAEAQRTIARPAAAPAAPVRAAAASRGGSPLAGVVVAVLAAFLVGLVGNVVLQAALLGGSGGSFLDSAGETLKNMAKFYPTMHQAHLWAKADLGRWQNVVSILLVIMSIVLGGLLAQAIGRGKRAATALGFAAVFVLATLIVQAALLQFKIQTMALYYSGLFRDLGPWPSFAVGIAYIFGVVFILSLLGTLLVRRSR
jgi:hypothetical protein